METLNEFFNVGDRTYGFCNGYFGGDDYCPKICVMVTSKYAIFQYLDGNWEGEAVALNNPELLTKKSVTEWKQENQDDF